MAPPKFISRLGHEVDVPDLQRAYLRVPDEVQVDLAEFCYATDPAPQASDLFIQGRAAGRRDVFLHIQEFLRLSQDELYALRRGQAITRITNGA